MNLRIPPADRAVLARLASLDGADVALIRSCLDSEPHERKPKELATSFAKCIDSLDEVELFKLASLLLNLYRIKENYERTTDEFVEDVCSSMQEPKDDISSINQTQSANLADHLRTLLTAEKYILDARASNLQIEAANIYENARILTDVRPVFTRDGDVELMGAVTLNTLRIAYSCESERKEIYFALDMGDLRQLKEAIERAESKNLKVQQFLAAARLQDLNRS